MQRPHPGQPAAPRRRARSRIAAIRADSPQLHVKAFTVAEYDFFAKRFKKPLDEVIARLLALEFREEDPQDRPTAANDVFAGLHTEARGAYLAAFEGRRLSDLRRSLEGSFTADGREGGEEGGPEGEENSQEEDAAHDRSALSSHDDPVI